jgi:arylsulfatase A-like enzyme
VSCPAGSPGYTAFVPKDCAPFPRVLQENGYSTAAFGKWHLTPDGQQGPAGPFDRWPNGWGFDYFWGFLGGESGQWDPVITENQKTIGVPEGKDGKPYYLPDDMADRTVEWLHGVRAQDQSKPWFVYFSTGCSHAPHVPKAWADKYKGRFDEGWDRLREETLQRQKRLGVVPADADLTPRNDAFPAWESLGEDQRRLYARQMEVYAGYQENADHNVGRVLDAVAEMGELDNTLVIWIWGDNGSSLEGTLTGSFNELTMQNGIPLTPEQQLALVQQYGGLDVWGTELIAPHFSAAWAWAGNAPSQWGKQVASHLGGTRNPAVVHWPSQVRDQGAVRQHFTHVIDVGPTILEVAGIPQPTHVDGIEQEPMHGLSFADSFADAAAPEHRTQQYFEIFGNRAIYKDGWWLAMMMPRIPWDATPDTMRKFAPSVWDPDSDPAELYYLPDDCTQARNLAADHPEKVAELQKLFWQEAERYKVLPLMGGMSVYFGVVPPMPTQSRFTFYGDVQNVASGMIPRIYNHSYTISAELQVPRAAPRA